MGHVSTSDWSNFKIKSTNRILTPDILKKFKNYTLTLKFKFLLHFSIFENYIFYLNFYENSKLAHGKNDNFIPKNLRFPQFSL